MGRQGVAELADRTQRRLRRERDAAIARDGESGDRGDPAGSFTDVTERDSGAFRKIENAGMNDGLGPLRDDEEHVARKVCQLRCPPRADAVRERHHSGDRLSAIHRLRRDAVTRAGAMHQPKVEVALVQARQLGAARKMHDVDVELDMARIEQAEEALKPLQVQIRGASESDMHAAQYSKNDLRRQSGKCRICSASSKLAGTQRLKRQLTGPSTWARTGRGRGACSYRASALGGFVPLDQKPLLVVDLDSHGGRRRGVGAAPAVTAVVTRSAGGRSLLQGMRERR